MHTKRRKLPSFFFSFLYKKLVSNTSYRRNVSQQTISHHSIILKEGGKPRNNTSPFINKKLITKYLLEEEGKLREDSSSILHEDLIGAAENRKGLPNTKGKAGSESCGWRPPWLCA